MLFRSLLYPLRFTEDLTESSSVSQAANAYSSSAMNESALLKIYSASAKIASVLSVAFIVCPDFLRGQPDFLGLQLMFSALSRNQYAPKMKKNFLYYTINYSKGTGICLRTSLALV